MNGCLARVDDRLIHGQILHGWVPKLHIQHLVVADAAMMADQQEQAIARLAVPADIQVDFVAPNQIAAFLEQCDADQRTLVLFRTPVQALEAISTGFLPDALNLGNLHFEPGKIQLRKTFCCSSGELRALKDIAGRGVPINYQPAPDLKRVALDLATL